MKSVISIARGLIIFVLVIVYIVLDLLRSMIDDLIEIASGWTLK